MDDIKYKTTRAETQENSSFPVGGHQAIQDKQKADEQIKLKNKTKTKTKTKQTNKQTNNGTTALERSVTNNLGEG